MLKTDKTIVYQDVIQHRIGNYLLILLKEVPAAIDSRFVLRSHSSERLETVRNEVRGEPTG
jgi:hypothetical protein